MTKSKKPLIADISISKKNVFITKSAEETRKLGESFASLLGKGDIVFLKGDLGSGKTTFTQGVVNAFGNKGFARSSSFTLVNEYETGKDGLKLFHMDLYRLAPSDIWSIGIEEYVYGGNISLIEWAERLTGDAKNDNTWSIDIETDGDERKIILRKMK
ncbi:MAG: tRNA (adenosine(37)-N6)-threonylcarbamoyltransferase complex ATPase subunit type 1 TsaE [Endomicrobia bacterium]|nr:tRNA (adenosine(37)-N6)-threonylcarbamoyltransferase complex ATPase subunit type 1 TsaE [Endomicrobiia bacterium]MCL2507055.1 tRNA (adenosine(37)-N6)-threonylcarbamoyltransferase complex ATPase subunit type 1 TsaE [Endomicrobiia bacterium]